MITLTVWMDTTVMYENRYARVLIRSNSCFIQVYIIPTIVHNAFYRHVFGFKYYYYEKFKFTVFGSTESMDNSTIVRDF